ncbi:cation:proton antiporter subunit C [Aggregatilineales bacterium SYSU G02658]
MNDSAALYAVAGVILFGMGIYALVAYPHLLRKILGMNVMGIGVFAVFVALAYRGPDQPPDPVPHALVITGIVVAVCATGLGLTLATRLKALTGVAQLTPDQED